MKSFTQALQREKKRTYGGREHDMSAKKAASMKRNDHTACTNEINS